MEQGAGAKGKSDLVRIGSTTSSRIRERLHGLGKKLFALYQGTTKIVR
jgi:hypothetical protein